MKVVLSNSLKAVRHRLKAYAGSRSVKSRSKRDKTEGSKRAIYRGAVHAAVVWGVNRERANHNPVFWHDGYLNYLSHYSHQQETYSILSRRGIMSDGFNGADRLNFTFEELDAALDRDFSAGIDFDIILELLILQYGYQWHFLEFKRDAGPFFTRFNKRWANETEVRAVFSHLANLGYLVRISEPNLESQYQWTTRAVPIVKKYAHIDIEL